MWKPKLSMKEIRHHFNYLGWLYIFVPVIMIFGWSLIYAVTEYTPEESKVLSFYMVGQYSDYDAVEALKNEIAPEFPEMEEFDFLSITVENVYDAANWQRFFTYVYAQQGDVMIIDKEIFDVLITDGLFMPLDDLISATDVGDIDLTLTTGVTEEDPTPRIYGIPADELYGFLEHELYDMRRSVLVVMVYSGNPQENIRLIEWFLENRQGTRPENIDEWAEKPTFYPEDGTLSDDMLNMW